MGAQILQFTYVFCCNQSFQNLHRHMQTKHPKWKGEE